MEGENANKFNNLVNSMKSTEKPSGLLNNKVNTEPESSRAIGQNAMGEVMAQAAASKKDNLAGTGSGLKSRV